ncbi:hypothetical protein [Paenibacillus sp. FSL R5-0912]|uniref:hypothetical protein n=1 Tax=Paenibacillus sp. FSL R5-0912 TaxID=1536771 RepID=UPI0004F649A1|nr:hypothetical protein [Paenibacillus sp. FSL R5-0912]AIQ40318.1 hypothetical protein R50912_09995 [Paenibacillus sp. FSL R5-0912]
MDLKIRFTVNTPSQQICFGNLNGIDHSETLEKIAEHFASWEKTLKERAAEHLLTETLGPEQASGYQISFVHKKESLPEVG